MLEESGQYALAYKVAESHDMTEKAEQLLAALKKSLAPAKTEEEGEEAEEDPTESQLEEELAAGEINPPLEVCGLHCTRAFAGGLWLGSATALGGEAVPMGHQRTADRGCLSLADVAHATPSTSLSLRIVISTWTSVETACCVLQMDPCRVGPWPAFLTGSQQLQISICIGHFWQR